MAKERCNASEIMTKASITTLSTTILVALRMLGLRHVTLCFRDPATHTMFPFPGALFEAACRPISITRVITCNHGNKSPS